ncbi:RmlC-like cupin domain-containing protein [Talaromyces proteolyticus]|uniref:RmlC-like cupin domain-containing protein n=1 Tax=Talaromyces proteolyticus TaxID=1131652 RepID=A0AAD4KG76_9EURO|nr:RmlC-like cupin domain-containing protein [Talaromyces proteolyticus]KAH8690455.1 RmlC-like cupin domain-containing protein [Talaromyces proteolyticus]
MKFDANDIAYTPTTGVTKVFELAVVQATPESIKGYGQIVESPENFPIEIVRWPAQGWRPVDANSGNQGGTTEGLFEFWWKDNTLYARNNAVGDNYLFAWSQFPEEASTSGVGKPRDMALIWRANYHPDGGQMFFPMDGQSFLIPLALPGDDVTPEKFVAFRCDGGKGLYIHPNIWHGAVVPIDDHSRFLDRQGRVHARVSVNFAKEFGGYISIPLRAAEKEKPQST